MHASLRLPRTLALTAIGCLALALALAAPTAHAAKKGKKKIASSVAVTDITLGTSLGTVEVSSKKAKCVKGRTVVVKQGSEKISSGKTDKQGVAQLATPAGDSVATLKKSKLSKKKLCKGDSAKIANGLSDPIPVTANLSFEPGVYENGSAGPNFFTPSWSSPDARCLAGNTARVLAGGNVQGSFDTEGQSSAGLGFNFDEPLQLGDWIVQIGSNVFEQAKKNGDYSVSFCETATSAPITIAAGSTEAQTEIDLSIPATTVPGEPTAFGEVITTPENKRCEGPGRSVVVQKDASDGDPVEWQNLGDALTDGAGEWSITDSFEVSGQFRANVFTQVMPASTPRQFVLCAGADGAPVA